MALDEACSIGASSFLAVTLKRARPHSVSWSSRRTLPVDVILRLM